MTWKQVWTWLEMTENVSYLIGMKTWHWDQMLTVAFLSMVVYAFKVTSLVYCSCFYQ